MEGKTVSPAAKSAPASSSTTGPMSLAQTSSGKFLKEQEGFKLNELYANSKLHPGVIFELIEMNESEAKFTERNLDFGQARTVTAKYEQLSKQWTLFKGKTQLRIEGDLSKFVQPESIQRDVARARVFVALADLAGKHKPDLVDFIFTMQPNEVRANSLKYAKKGSLQLIPMVSGIDQLGTKKTGVISVKFNGEISVEIQSPAKPRAVTIAEWNETQIISPFWWVVTSSKPEEVNMTYGKLEQDGFTFKILKNSKVLKMHDKLVVFKAAKPEAKAKAGEMPAKRSKTS